MFSITLLQKNFHCLLLWSIIIFPKPIKCWGKYRIMYDFRNSWEFPGILTSHTQIPKNICWEFGNALWSFTSVTSLDSASHPIPKAAALIIRPLSSLLTLWVRLQTPPAHPPRCRGIFLRQKLSLSFGCEIHPWPPNSFTSVFQNASWDSGYIKTSGSF